jgi:hypothetical protein
MMHLTSEANERIARQCFGEPNPRLSTCRELRFGRRGSKAVNIERGVFADHEAGVSGGLLAMVVHAGAARTAAEAARLLEGQGLTASRQTAAQRQEHARQQGVEEQRRRASAAILWAQASPLGGSLAELYLRQARAIDAALARADLRFLAAAPVYPYDLHCRDRRPTMIGRVVDSTGRGIGAHLTYLRPDGRGKADFTPARKCIGVVARGGIRLAAGSRLVIAEGIETALSAWEALGRQVPGLGCMATVSAGGMAHLVWPAGTIELFIAPDKDAGGAGERAAHTLAVRAHASSLAVSFVPPPEAFNDWSAAAQAGWGRP